MVVVTFKMGGIGDFTDKEVNIERLDERQAGIRSDPEGPHMTCKEFGIQPESFGKPLEEGDHSNKSQESGFWGGA